MAKKVQMSTVELVVAKLEAKGWTVDDVELSNGWVTVWANAYGEKIEGASFKQAQANKWADGVMDMNPVQADEDMSLEEWEQQYGSLSDEDVQAFLMEELVAKSEAQAEREDEQRVQRFVDEEVEPAADAAPETHEEEMVKDLRYEQDLEAENAIIESELAKAQALFAQGLLDEPLAILRAAQSSKGGIITKGHPLWDAYEELGGAICKARRAAKRAAKKAAPETPEGDEMSEEVKGVGCWKCGVIFEPEKAALDEWGNSGQPFEPTDWTCPECEDLERLADEATVKEAREKEENLYTQYMAVREDYFEDHADLAMVFEAMTFRRFLVVRYQTDYANGTSVIRERKLLPSHVYQAKSTEGVCVVAWDSYRKEIRTFRIDKFRACRLGEIAPAAAGDAVTIYPAAYEVRKSVPQRVKNPGKYLATGNWSTLPLPQVLVQ